MSTPSGIHVLTLYRAWWRYFTDIALAHFPKANGQNRNKHWKANSQVPDRSG